MEYSIACCYLTHNHPSVVKSVLTECCEDYANHGIDIFIYDSSEGKETQKIVEELIAKGHENVYYIDARFITTGDEKYIYVLQGYGLPKHYDYIWPSKDRCYYKGETLDEIVRAINQGYDVVFAVSEGNRYELVVPQIQNIYTNCVEFFHHYGQLCTNWESLIRKTETMLDPIDWPQFIVSNRMGAENHFNQPISLFSRLADMSKYTIKIVRNLFGDKIYSNLSSSSWRDSVMSVWIDNWIPAIYNLPNVYDPYKLEVIKSELGVAPLFGSTDSLIELNESNQITNERYGQLTSIWSMITDYPIENFELIMKKEYDMLFSSIVDKFECALANHDYRSAYKIFWENKWLRETYGEKYSVLVNCFNKYRYELFTNGKSSLFEGVSSVEELISRYEERN